MIKECITSILIILIFINSLGCTSYNAIKKDDINSIEEGSAIILTTVDNKEYLLTYVTVNDSILSGNQWVENKIMERRTEFSAEEILKIEVEEFDTSSTIWLCAGIIVVIYVGWKSNSKLHGGNWF